MRKSGGLVSAELLTTAKFPSMEMTLLRLEVTVIAPKLAFIVTEALTGRDITHSSETVSAQNTKADRRLQVVAAGATEFFRTATSRMDKECDDVETVPEHLFAAPVLVSVRESTMT
jgi:hypothetical protein